jgi:hypothetical protein
VTATAVTEEVVVQPDPAAGSGPAPQLHPIEYLGFFSSGPFLSVPVRNVGAMTSTGSIVQNITDTEAREALAGYRGSEKLDVGLLSDQVERLTDNGIMRVLKAAAAEVARLQALQLRGVAALSRRRENPRSTEAELSLALCLSPRSAAAVIATAEALTTRLPETFALMERGSLDLLRARKVTVATAWLSDEAARTADAELAPRLPGKNATQVRKAAAYAAQKADPEGDDRRTRMRRENRRFTLTHRQPGTAKLTVNEAPVDKAVAAYTRVDRLARSLKTKEEPRTLDQLRADVTLDLLLCAEGGGATPRIEGYLYMDLHTYLGLNSTPAELSGHGPISAALARELLSGPDTVLRRIITDPLTGQAQDLGRTPYRPTASTAEFVRVRDRECRRPGCTRPAHACEADHIVDERDGGPARTASLAAFCSCDYHLKDEPGWQYDMSEDGTLTITTPAGLVHRSTPPPLHDPRPAEEAAA